MTRSGSRFPGRIVLVVVIGAVVGLGGIFLVKSLLSSARDDASIKQIEGWAERWRRTRSCLVGTHPYASSAALAVELREATTSGLRAMYTRCVLLVERNERPEGPAARDERVESDWADLLDAMKNLEASLRFRLNGYSQERARRVGHALQGVDEAYARLRKHARMAPAPVAGQIKQLAVLKTSPLRWKRGTVRANRLRQWGPRLIASVYNRAKRRERRHVITGPGKVETTERFFDEGSVVPGVVVEAIEEDAEKTDKKPKQPPAPNKPATDTEADTEVDTEAEAPPTHTLVVRHKEETQLVARVAGRPTPLFYLRHDDARIVGWKLSADLHVAESVDGGKTWKRVFSSKAADWGLIPLSWSHVDVWMSRSGAASHLSIDAKASERLWTPVQISDAGLSRGLQMCYGTKVIWWGLVGGAIHQATIVRAGDGKNEIIGKRQPLTAITSCTDELLIGVGGKLLRNAQGLHSDSAQLMPVIVCTKSSCRRPFEALLGGRAKIGAIMSPQGQLVVAAHTKRILTVWRDGTRRIYRLRTKARLVRLASFDAKVYAVLMYDHKLRLVALP